MTRIVPSLGQGWRLSFGWARQRRRRRVQYEFWVRRWLAPLLRAVEALVVEHGHEATFALQRRHDALVARLEVRHRRRDAADPIPLLEFSMGTLPGSVAVRRTHVVPRGRSWQGGVETLWTCPQGEAGDVLIAFMSDVFPGGRTEEQLEDDVVRPLWIEVLPSRR